MNTRTIVGFVGVYNAKGGVRGEAAYILAKIVGRDGCSLCETTHAGLRRRPEFDKACADVAMPFELLHRDRCSDELLHVSGGQVPVVLGRTADETLVLLLGPAEIDACDRDPERLLRSAREAAAAHGLGWGSEK